MKWCLTLTLSLISFVTSYHHHHRYHGHHCDRPDHDSDRDFFKHFNDDDDSGDYSSEEYIDHTTSSSQAVYRLSPATERVMKSYEVTEIVDDIPNSNSLPPIFTNFTINRPLNVAVTRNNTDDGANNELDNSKVKRNEITKPNGVVNSVTSSIMSYLNDIRDRISATDSPSNVNHGVHVPNIVAKPLLFFDKIRQKTADVAEHVHKSIFKHFDDYK